MTETIHYRLTNSEWLNLCANLTYAEVKVLMHLRTIDPFGDRFKNADTGKIAVTLGITPRSVQRALCSLATKELIDLEFTGFKFRLRSKLATSTSPSDTEIATSMSPSDTEIATSMSPSDTEIATSTSPSDTEIATRDIHVAETTPMSPKRHTDRDRLLEPLIDNGSGTSHTIHTLQTLKKEEREIRKAKRDEVVRNPRTVENSPSWDEPEPLKTKPKTTPFKTQVSVDIDQCSAPPSPTQNFDFEAFDWASYSKPRSGGSDPEYFAWAIAQVTQYNDEKVSQGKPSIGDIQSYTRSTIQNRGAKGYLKYLQSKGLAPNTLKPPTPPPTPPKDLNWQTPKSSELAIYSDLSEQLAAIQAHLKLNQWSWSTPRLQVWIAMATDTAQRWAWPTIDFQPILGCSNWPDWAIAKLAQDLEAGSHA
jgi:hypothetical protein